MGSLMLLDTASLYYRAFFGVPETVRAPDGTPVNAIRGLLDMISRLVRARHPARLVACLDADWRPAFRVAAVPSYKAHRLAADGTSEETPPALAAQVPLIEEVLHGRGAGGRRAARVRGGRRDGHAGGQVRRPGRRGHRRPGPVPAGRRRPRGAGHLHRARPDEHGRDRRGGGDREVRHPRPRLRRLRRAARRPERRAARGAGRGGEDRGRADPARSAASRGSPRRWTPATAGFPAAAGTSWRRPGSTWTSPCPWSRWPTTRRCRTSTGRCPRCLPTQTGCSELGDRWGLGSSLGRFVSAVSPSRAGLASMS